MTAWLIKNPRRKVGLPPGTLVFTGDQKVEEIRLTVFNHDGGVLQEEMVATPEAAFPYLDSQGLSWVNVDGLHDVEVIRTLGERVGLSTLLLEDILNTGHRPSIEELSNVLFISVKMLYHDDARRLRVEQVSIVAGPTWVLSFQEVPGDVFEAVRKRLRENGQRIYHRGAMYLAYVLLDVIVDHYFVMLEEISDAMEAVENAVLENPTPATQRRIRDLHRELVLIRKAAWPTRELFNRLERSESPLVTEELKPFLRDLYDHGVQVLDIIESLRDVLSGLRDLYQTTLDHRMNEIMKVLTIIGTIFIPLTFIAGIYGMNFDNMPELHATYGYPIALGVMVVLALGLLYYFRRKRWI